MSHDTANRTYDQAKPADYENEAPPLRVEMLLFFLGIFFFGPIAIAYLLVTDGEPVGSVAFFLLAGMTAMVGAYLWLLSRRVDRRPEDDPFGEIIEREGQIGEFSPHSWWPLVLGIAVTVIFAGVAIGIWVVVIGVIVALIGVCGLLFEFSSGIHAH
ncbi:MAG: cytochrome c oxidase subunit 4 [Bowdeniella nasicola]|nr:cytochrome c oxidase subunit 4 [Bowdeniella nasicola]